MSEIKTLKEWAEKGYSTTLGKPFENKKLVSVESEIAFLKQLTDFVKHVFICYGVCIIWKMILESIIAKSVANIILRMTNMNKIFKRLRVNKFRRTNMEKKTGLMGDVKKWTY